MEYNSPTLIGPPFSVEESEVRRLLGSALNVTRLSQRVGLSQLSPKFSRLAVTEAVYLLRQN